MTAKANIRMLEHASIIVSREKKQREVPTYVHSISTDDLVPLKSCSYEKFDNLFYRKSDKQVYTLTQFGYCPRRPQTKRNAPGIEFIVVHTKEGRKVAVRIHNLLRENGI